MKKIGILFSLFFFLISFRLEAAPQKRDSKASQTQKTFQASSLWGVRRGPNAPQTSSSPEGVKSSAAPSEADSLNALYEQKAKNAYTENRYGMSAQSVKTSSSVPQECAAGKKS